MNLKQLRDNYKKRIIQNIQECYRPFIKLKAIKEHSELKRLIQNYNNNEGKSFEEPKLHIKKSILILDQITIEFLNAIRRNQNKSKITEFLHILDYLNETKRNILLHDMWNDDMSFIKYIESNLDGKLSFLTKENSKLVLNQILEPYSVKIHENELVLFLEKSFSNNIYKLKIDKKHFSHFQFNQDQLISYVMHEKQTQIYFFDHIHSVIIHIPNFIIFLHDSLESVVLNFNTNLNIDDDITRDVFLAIINSHKQKFKILEFSIEIGDLQYYYCKKSNLIISQELIVNKVLNFMEINFIHSNREIIRQMKKDLLLQIDEEVLLSDINNFLINCKDLNDLTLYQVSDEMYLINQKKIMEGIYNLLEKSNWGYITFDKILDKLVINSNRNVIENYIFNSNPYQDRNKYHYQLITTKKTKKDNIIIFPEIILEKILQKLLEGNKIQQIQQNYNFYLKSNQLYDELLSFFAKKTKSLQI